VGVVRSWLPKTDPTWESRALRSLYTCLESRWSFRSRPRMRSAIVASESSSGCRVGCRSSRICSASCRWTPRAAWFLTRYQNDFSTPWMWFTSLVRFATNASPERITARSTRVDRSRCWPSGTGASDPCGPPVSTARRSVRSFFESVWKIVRSMRALATITPRPNSSKSYDTQAECPRPLSLDACEPGPRTAHAVPWVSSRGGSPQRPLHPCRARRHGSCARQDRYQSSCLSEGW